MNVEFQGYSKEFVCEMIKQLSPGLKITSVEPFYYQALVGALGIRAITVDDLNKGLGNASNKLFFASVMFQSSKQDGNGEFSIEMSYPSDLPAPLIVGGNLTLDLNSSIEQVNHVKTDFPVLFNKFNSLVYAWSETINLVCIGFVINYQ